MADQPFDATLKDLVECGPEDWTVIAGLPPGLTRLIDADIATVTGAADKVLRVDSFTSYLLHLEFLSGHDAAAQPRKMQKRNILLEDRHDLAVRTLAVVLRPGADSPTLTGVHQRVFPGQAEPYSLFRYDVIRVWQLPPQRLLAGGLGTLPLAPISAVTESELPDIIKKMAQRLQKGDDSVGSHVYPDGLAVFGRGGRRTLAWSSIDAGINNIPENIARRHG
jgi:hypothetical protein